MVFFLFYKCNWWGHASGPGGAGPGSGDGVVGAGLDFEPWLTAAAPGGLCNGPLSAKGAKQAILADLQAMVPHADKDTNKKLNEAIESVEDSLAANLWVDDNHLDPKKGDKVFNEERKAVQKLRDIKNPTAEMSAAAVSLVNVDRMLAETAINEAPAGKDKDKALDDFAKGDQEKNLGNLEKAVEHYRNAWKHINQ